MSAPNKAGKGNTFDRFFDSARDLGDYRSDFAVDDFSDLVDEGDDLAKPLLRLGILTVLFITVFALMAFYIQGNIADRDNPNGIKAIAAVQIDTDKNDSAVKGPRRFAELSQIK